MLRSFKEFAVRGNVVDMAVGIIVGGAFTSVVTSLVNDVIMPPIGMVTGGLDFTDKFVILRDGATPSPYVSLAEAKTAGAVVLSYGMFINSVVAFLIVAAVLFFVVRWINELRRPDTPAAPQTKSCPECMTAIHLDARRCPQCTSVLVERAPQTA